jgi:hypothetical protein
MFCPECLRRIRVVHEPIATTATVPATRRCRDCGTRLVPSLSD